VGVIPLQRGRTYSPADLAAVIGNTCSGHIARHVLRDRLMPATCPLRADDSALAPMTIAVCTRNRTASLAGCLDALAALDYPSGLLDVLTVDNAPPDDRTERLVRERHPAFRYLAEPRPGLNWARNRAALEARHGVLAFVDDDVRVERGWARAIAAAFAREPEAMAVTGLVVPAETDAEPQLLFERYGGFGRGFTRRYFQVDAAGGERAGWRHGGAGQFGTGANMAFRRQLFDAVGLFDPALDVGTATNGGGDLDMFFRVLKHGHLLVYEPAAIVRHAHRRSYGELREQIANNGVGFYSYLVRTARVYRDERAAIAFLGAWWLWWWNMRRLLVSFVRPPPIPRDLMVAEALGSLRGLFRYRRARLQAARVLATFGPQRTGR
jgi:GT2 family glycosyltransferase